MGTTPQSRGDRGIVQYVDLLEFAMEQANDGIAVMRFTGDSEIPIRIVYANETIERLSGFTRAELLDESNPFLRVQPQNRARYDRLLEQVRAGESVRFEIALGGKDRSTWCEIRWSPLQHAGKEVSHYVAVLREHAVQRSPDAVCILELAQASDEPYRVVFVNDSMCAMLDMAREQIIAQGLGTVADPLKGEAFERELLLRRRDGTARWVHVAGTPANAEPGQPDRITITCRDIDERKRKDEEAKLLQSVLSQTTDFVVIADAARPSERGPSVTYANPAFASVLGVQHDDVTGKVLTDFMVASCDDTTITGLHSRLERHLPVSYELQVRNAQTGNAVWIELSGQPVRDENGQSVSWIFVGKDINLRKQSYVQTAQLLTALDLADEPIAIYSVVGPLVLEPQHMNRRAAEFERPLIETALADHRQRKRFEDAWRILEQGNNIKRLICAGGNDPRRWITLELRPMKSARALNTVIAIEHLVSTQEEGQDEITAVLALSREIATFQDLGSRVDAFLEVLRCEWDISARFSAARRDFDLVLRAKEHNGYMVIPAGVLFDRPVAVDFFWTSTLAPRRLTALRIFLETLGRRD
ncbi:MAG: PAS domain-containing protein [Candidatus Eremiobacteraeota bacterium]|nr:PAS domain-containing protein [Candidatus Eremiobacteraeota bacterium]